MDEALKAHAQRRLLAPGTRVFPAACVVGLLLVTIYVLGSGTWLDEYWQLWVSGAPARLIAERFGADAHPPLFNFVARGIIALTGSNLIWARLTNLGLAVVALGFALGSMTGLRSELRWRIFLLVSASAGLVGMTHLASSFRVYPWVLVMGSLQGSLLLCVSERRSFPLFLGVGVTILSIMLQYVHAAGAIVIALVSAWVAWRNGDRRAAIALMCGAAGGAILDLLTGFAQLPFWKAIYDVNWIGDSGASPWQTIGEVFGNYLLFNLAGAGLIGLSILRGEWKRVLIVLTPVPVALLLWVVMGTIQPLLVPRYLASLAGLFSVAAAAGWTDLELEPPANSVVAFLVALQPLFYGLVAPPRTGWEEGARLSAAAVQQCPGSALYAVPAWRFRDQPNSKTARFETPVMGFGYESVGQRFALDPQVVVKPIDVHLGKCPAIIWMEAGHGIERVPVAVVLKRAQLRIGQPFTAKFEPTQNGAVLLISRSNRLGLSQ